MLLDYFPLLQNTVPTLLGDILRHSQRHFYVSQSILSIGLLYTPV